MCIALPPTEEIANRSLGRSDGHAKVKSREHPWGTLAAQTVSTRTCLGGLGGLGGHKPVQEVRWNRTETLEKRYAQWVRRDMRAQKHGNYNIF